MRASCTQITLLIGGLGLLAACSEEARPRGVAEFIEQPMMLEAAMVRCLQDRTATRYDRECMNARQAAQQIEAKVTAASRAELEAMSERKRQALRRTMEAVRKARQRAAENERLRIEAEYHAQFGVLPPKEGVGYENEAVPPEAPEQESGLVGAVLPASDGGNAPMSSAAPDEEEPQSDLESVRQELERRTDEGGN